MLEKGPAEHPYYGARVKIIEEKIIFNNDHKEKSEIHFENVSKISVVSYNKTQPQKDFWVYFWPLVGGEKVSVPSRAGGFEKLMLVLDDWPGLTSDKLKDAIQQVNEKHTLVYEKKDLKASITAQLISTKRNVAFEKIERGLWLDLREELIPWGRFGDLNNIKGMQKKWIDPPNPLFHQFNYSLHNVSILNGIRVNRLTTQTPGIRKIFGKRYKTWPVTGYWTSILLENSGKETFSKIGHHITGAWKDPSLLEEHTVKWQQGSVSIVLTRYKKEELQTYDEACSLNILFNPDLAPFFTNAYQQHLQLEDLITYKSFPLNFKISEDYIHITNAFYTPNCFSSLFNQSHQSLIWIDEREQKIGFANPRFCRIFKWKKKSRLLLVTLYWRDRLSGYELCYSPSKQDDWQRVASFSAKEDFVEKYFIEQLGKLTKRTCQRTEKRTYY